MPPLAGQTDLAGAAGVLILSAEDTSEQTIWPRLDAAGADVERIHIAEATTIGEQGERPPVLPSELDLVEELARERGVKLIIVDPFMAYLDGELNAHKDQDVRRCLHRLKMLSEKTGAALVLVRHLNKLARFAHRASGCLASIFTDATGRQKGVFGFSKLGYPPHNRRFSPVLRRVSPRATARRLAHPHKAHLRGSTDAPGKTHAASPRNCATKPRTPW
jgi:hypothetical protein